MLALASLDGQGPWVLAFAGLPGAGKTVQAERLALLTRWSVLNRDQIREQTHPGDATELARKLADERLLRRVGTGLRAGMCLIVDGKSFASAQDRAALAEVVDDAGGRLQWVWLDLPVEVAAARVAQDLGHPAADRDSQLVRSIASRFQPLSDAAWRLDACASPDDLQQQLFSRLLRLLQAI